jgi:hypothetical protein
MHAQNRGRHQRHPHPHCHGSRNCKEKVSQLVQLVTVTGLLDSWQDQGLVLGCWLVDNGRYLSGDGSWLKRCGSGRNTQRKEKGGISWTGTDM